MTHGPLVYIKILSGFCWKGKENICWSMLFQCRLIVLRWALFISFLRLMFTNIPYWFTFQTFNLTVQSSMANSTLTTSIPVCSFAFAVFTRWRIITGFMEMTCCWNLENKRTGQNTIHVSWRHWHPFPIL